jgi:hypothetical protein
MIIRVYYDKSTQTLSVEGDVTGIELNNSTVQDDSNVLEFEIAVDTSQYELEGAEEFLDPETE